MIFSGLFSAGKNTPAATDDGSFPRPIDPPGSVAARNRVAGEAAEGGEPVGIGQGIERAFGGFGPFVGAAAAVGDAARLRDGRENIRHRRGVAVFDDRAKTLAYRRL